MFRMNITACFLGLFAWKLFPGFSSEGVSVVVTEVCVLYAAKCWVLFMYSVSLSMSFYWGIESTDVKKF